MNSGDLFPQHFVLPDPMTAMNLSVRNILKLSLVFALIISLALRAHAAEPYTVKIGMILTLTGPYAEFGKAQIQALQLAQETFPDRFSHLKFITEDCQYSGKEAASAFNKLRTIDQADLIFVFGVEPALAVAPVAERSKFPLIVSAVDPSTARGRKYVIRTINYAEQQAQTILKYFRTLNYKKIGILKAQMSFYNILTDGMQQNLASGESLEVIEDLLPTETDLKSVIPKLRGKSLDVLGLFLSPGQILQYFKESDSQKFHTQTFGASPIQSRTLVGQAQGKMEGTLFVHNDVSKEFHSAYTKRFGNDIQIPWAANAYDFVNLAGTLFNNLQHPPTAEDVLTSLSTANVDNGAGGPYHFVDSPEEGKYFEYPIVVKKIEGSEFREVFKQSFPHP